jgi:group I intron endonuclease
MTKRPILCGIYRILNTITGKSYIGSSIDIHVRWTYHRRQLKLQSHGTIKLLRSWNKYGPDVWEWSILQECEESRLEWLEAFWMDRFDAVKNGYNESVLTLEDGLLQRRHSEESKAKMKGRVFSEETKKRMSDSRMGMKLSEETISRLRGRKHTEETKIKFSKRTPGFLGKSHTEETKEKLKGRKVSEETRAKMSAAASARKRGKHSEETLAKLRKPHSAEHNSKVGRKGRVLSEEHKEKIRLAHTGLKLSEEAKEGMRGRVTSDETKRKLSAARKGKKLTEEQKAKMRKPHSAEHNAKVRKSRWGLE